MTKHDLNFRSSIPSLPTSPDDATAATTSGHDSVDCPPTHILRPDDNRGGLEASRGYPLQQARLDQEPDVVMVIPLYDGRCDEPPGEGQSQLTDI